MPKFSKFRKSKPKSKGKVLAKMVHKDHKLIKELFAGERHLYFSSADGTAIPTIIGISTTVQPPVIDCITSTATGSLGGNRSGLRIQPLRLRANMFINADRLSNDTINVTGFRPGVNVRTMLVWYSTPGGTPGIAGASTVPLWEDLLYLGAGTQDSTSLLGFPATYLKPKGIMKVLYDKVVFCQNRLAVVGSTAACPSIQHHLKINLDLSKLPPTTYNATGARSTIGVNVQSGALYWIVFSDNINANTNPPLYFINYQFEFFG